MTKIPVYTILLLTVSAIMLIGFNIMAVTTSYIPPQPWQLVVFNTVSILGIIYATGVFYANNEMEDC